MATVELKKMEMTSASGANINLEALYQICPQAFTEVRDERTGQVTQKINFTTLRQLLGDNAYEGADEEYGFNWVGKRAAIQEAGRATRKTLRPCPEESVDWDNTQNLYIEGDNLDILKLLQKSYLGAIKMIYIDPPYNTGSDFVYRDDFAMGSDEYDLQAGNVDELGKRYRKNTDTNARFHSDWCSMIYERLLVSRSLLTDDGVIFISIDDNEAENLKKICNEVFGENGFVAQFIWEKRVNRENRKEISVRHDYILCFSKQEYQDGTRRIFQLPMNEKALSNYGNPDNDPRGPWKSDPAHAQGGHGTPTQFYTLVAPNGKRHELPSGRCWLYTEKEMLRAISENRIWFGSDGNGVPRVKTYLYAKERGLTPETLLFAELVSTNEKAKNDLKKLFDGYAVFETPKPKELIEQFIRISCKSGYVLDFFSGSAATAHAVMQLNAEDGGNRRFIMAQIPEETDEKSEARKAGYATICEIGKERIRRAGKKVKEDASLLAQGLDTGFRVFKLDDSNMEDVYFAPDELTQGKIKGLIDNVKPDRSDLDLLFGCMIDWGVQLSLPLSKKMVGGKTIHVVNDGELVACFDNEIDEDVISAIAELSPQRVVFKDSGFASAPLKINLFEIFKQKCGWSEEKVANHINII